MNGRMAAALFLNFAFLILNYLLQPFSQAAQSFMGARDDLHADDRAHLRRRRSAGIRCRFHGGNVAPEKRGDIATADFFPARELHVRSFAGLRKSSLPPSSTTQTDQYFSQSR